MDEARVRVFRKKPVEIEAMRFAAIEDAAALYEWSGGVVRPHDGDPVPSRATMLMVATLEGEMAVSLGAWVIRGVQGEFYPCKADIFAATYEPVGEPVENPVEAHR